MYRVQQIFPAYMCNGIISTLGHMHFSKFEAIGLDHEKMMS